MKVVVIIFAIAEWKAVKEIFPHLEMMQFPYGECSDLQPFENLRASLSTFNLRLFHGGWGKIASAGALQYVIDHETPDLIVNLGTCGGFGGGVNQGDIVVVEKTWVYDVVELMGALDIIPYYASSLDLSWLPEPWPYPARRGLIASADSDLQPDKIAFLKSQGAIVADWESAALAWVAQKNGTRILILRGVTDLVNEQGGEAYENLQLFEERTREIMRTLFEQLPDWLAIIKK